MGYVHRWDLISVCSASIIFIILCFSLAMAIFSEVYYSAFDSYALFWDPYSMRLGRSHYPIFLMIIIADRHCFIMISDWSDNHQFFITLFGVANQNAKLNSSSGCYPWAKIPVIHRFDWLEEPLINFWFS